MARIHRIDECAPEALRAGDVRFGERPLVVRGLVRQWPAHARWTREFMRERFARTSIPVLWHRREPADAPAWKGSVPFPEFLDRLDRAADAGEVLYIDEWGVFLEDPELWADVVLPPFFARDWFSALPESWRMSRSHRANVRWGSAHSRTTLHCDTYFAMAWLAVLRGRKRAVLFPRQLVAGWDAREGTIAGRAHGRRITGMHPLVLEALASDDPVAGLAGLSVDEAWYGEVDDGDFLFLPSRWYHAVLNPEETFSVGGFVVNEQSADALAAYFRHIGDPDATALSRWLFDSRGARAWTRTALGRRVLGHPTVARLGHAVLGDPG